MILQELHYKLAKGYLTEKKTIEELFVLVVEQGLAPFIAFANHFHDTNDKRELIILHGASYIDELSYKRLLTDLENDSKKRGK